MKTLIALLLTITAQAADYSKPSFMYVYDYDNAVTGTAGEREQILGFAKANGLTNIALSANRYFDYPSKQPALTAFITIAKTTYGIDTTLVLGSYTSVLTVNHQAILDLTKKAIDYTKSVTIKPIAFQYDIEPHALPEWDKDMVGTANQYLDLIKKLVDLNTANGVTIQFTTANFYAGKSIKRGTVTASLSKFIIDTLGVNDSIVVMNYRDDVPYVKVNKSSTGKLSKQTYSNKIIGTTTTHYVADDIAYANTKKKKVYEAFNTHCKVATDFNVTEDQCNKVMALDKVAYAAYNGNCSTYWDYKASSFCEEGNAKMLTAGKLLNTTYTAKYLGYQGWGIFAYKYFQGLKP